MKEKKQAPDARDLLLRLRECAAVCGVAAQ